MGGDIHDDELELLGRARDGDRAAMRRIVQRHQDDVYYLALGLLGNRDDAEDAMQEVFVKAIKALGRFRGQAGLSTWLYRITVNVCRDQQRRRRWKFFSLDTSPSERRTMVETVDSEDPHRKVTDQRLRQALMIALDRLSPTERQVFALRQFQELSVKETAEVLGIAEGSVKALLHRGLHKLRDELSAWQPAEAGS